MICYTIEAAIGCKFFTEIIIITDDVDIIKICQQYDYDPRIVIYREKDPKPEGKKAWKLVREVCKGYIEVQAEVLVFYLQPTSPLRTSNDIEKAFALYLETNNNGIIPGYWNPFEKVIQLNGAVFIMTLEEILKNKAVMVDNPTVYIFPRDKATDIDTIKEFKEAERLMGHELS